MFRKILIMSLPMLVMLGTLTAVTVLDRQRKADWERQVDEYFAQTSPPAMSVHVQAAVSARQPWNFHEGMASAFIDAGEWPWNIDRLPFPVDSLYCVLVEGNPTTPANSNIEPTHRLLYVAHHSDKLWRVGWIVYEGPAAPFAQDVVNDLATLGCDQPQV